MDGDDPSGQEKGGTENGSPATPAQINPSATASPTGQTADEHEAKAIKDAEEPLIRLTRALVRWTGVLAFAALVAIGVSVAQCSEMKGQLAEMKSGGVDTKNLASAAKDQAIATKNLVAAEQEAAGAAMFQADAMDKLRKAGEAQALAMAQLRAAGEIQAAASRNLADAGRTQAAATRDLATNSANQLTAIQASADAAKVQAAAVSKSADATVQASQATDRLAMAGKDQSAAVLESLATAKEANKIASDASTATNRPWVSIQAPVGAHELVAGMDYQVEISVTNPGRSPATNVQVAVKIEFLPVTGIVGDLDSCSQCARFTLFPSVGLDGGVQAFRLTIKKEEITPAHMAAYQNFTEAILIRARADYTDGAGNPHHTLMCVAYVPQSKGLGGFTSCNSGNKAD